LPSQTIVNTNPRFRSFVMEQRKQIAIDGRALSSDSTIADIVLENVIHIHATMIVTTTAFPGIVPDPDARISGIEHRLAHPERSQSK
jgi:hypothetical protein